jgi:hypothetical protein
MNIQHYQEFKEFEEKGLKEKATNSIRTFISSFQSIEEKKQWVWEFLSGLDTDQHFRIRHEIFHELVYPVLKAGYDNKDLYSTLWLGKLSQNIYRSRQLHEELGWVTEMELYNKSYDIDPENNEVRILLLKAIISWLEYTAHEWPNGILYGNDGASIAECDEIYAEVQRVLQLDTEKIYSEFIQQYTEKLDIYRNRLEKFT